MFVLSLFQLLYGLSWVILFGGVVLMCFRPNPSEAMLTAIMVTIMGAFYYIAAYFVLRGIVRPVRLRPSRGARPPGSRCVIRRVILEEVVPHEAGHPSTAWWSKKWPPTTKGMAMLDNHEALNGVSTTAYVGRQRQAQDLEAAVQEKARILTRTYQRDNRLLWALAVMTTLLAALGAANIWQGRTGVRGSALRGPGGSPGQPCPAAQTGGPARHPGAEHHCRHAHDVAGARPHDQ